MSATVNRAEHLADRLEKSSHRFDFYQAMRLLERAHRDKPRLGQSFRPADDALRLGQDAELCFQSTPLGPYRRAGERPARLAVNLLGLLGADGPMPLHLTEYVRERQHHAGDHTLAAFLDIFHHRILSLLYRSWASSQPVISRDRPDDDRFADYLGSLSGQSARASLPDAARQCAHEQDHLHFTGLLAGKTRHAAGLALLLSQYFGLPVAIEQFVGQWLALPAKAHTRLGARGGSSTLGKGCVLGKKVWDCQHKFRIVIGPLDQADYDRLLPGGASFSRLQAWVRQYVGHALDWDVELRLKPAAIKGTRLGDGAGMGLGTWLAAGSAKESARRLLIKPRGGPG
ncbi:type VI secretion system baseplate subunit TssG [Chitinimonas arctica]|uniref:Type VI secretion system baseplate subunit TssG n=1 Tax=Chitinimonas arctica TaxID=2594795 RepID=A0A516SBJ5_9NEIS|nr:type VI secretion system baseplate subunit TssG [Chitinimonas arctica]QDQ25438.1 type VI secretion system baseplate subunit TssG [Chitinimonas arctica]